MANTNKKRWYVVHVHSGYEKKVVASVNEQASQKGLDHLIEDVLVPSHKTVQVRRGKKYDAEKNFFPGYVLIKMELTDESWYMIKNTPRVTNFLGNKDKPTPISEAEAQRILDQVKEGVEKSVPDVTFEIGEQVRVCDGPFSSFSGVVQEIDEEKAKLKVSISIFGRPTPVELEYTQVEKT